MTQYADISVLDSSPILGIARDKSRGFKGTQAILGGKSRNDCPSPLRLDLAIHNWSLKKRNYAPGSLKLIPLALASIFIALGLSGCGTTTTVDSACQEYRTSNFKNLVPAFGKLARENPTYSEYLDAAVDIVNYEKWLLSYKKQLKLFNQTSGYKVRPIEISSTPRDLAMKKLKNFCRQ